MASFQTFNPSYEKIASRMDRLKHVSSNKTLPNQRSAVVTSGKIQPNNSSALHIHSNADLNQGYHANYRNRFSPLKQSPTSKLLFAEENVEKFTGRVTKNAGIRKFNQRQIKEIVNSSVLKQSIDGPKAEAVNYRGMAFRQSYEINEIKVQTPAPEVRRSYASRLIPGKLYSRRQIQET